MKKFVIAIILIAFAVAAAAVYFFHKEEILNADTDIELHDTKENDNETTAEYDYESAIKNAVMEFGTYNSMQKHIQNAAVDTGLEENRKEIEKERNSRLREQFRLKDIPNDFYFDTKIPFFN